tara:strand:- start:926 stop:4072 length:3147 start_codon:yes stop_codon:yes gene_type:complete
MLELYDNSSGTSGNIKVDGVNMSIINGGNNGDLILECDNGSNGVTQYLRLDGDVEKVIYSRGIEVGVDDTGYDVKFFGATAGSYMLWDESTDDLVLAGACKVGIGTTSPLDLLHIKSSSTDARFLIDGHTDADAEIKFAEAGSVKYTIGHDAASDNFVIGTTNVDSGQRLVIDSTGNVGIGTTSPENKLHIFAGESGGAASLGLVTIEDDNHAYLQFLTPSTKEQGVLFGDSDNNVGGVTYSHVTDAMMLTTNASERLRIDSSGNVGIGTDSPLNSFQISEYTVGSNGAQSVSGTASIFADSGDDALYLGLKNGSYPNRGYSFQTVANGVNADFVIKEHGQTGERLRIASSGNVGIGCTAPEAKLEINATSAASIFLRSSDTNPAESSRIRFAETFTTYQGGFVHYDGSANVLNIGMHPTSDETIGNDINAISIARADGNVGIGTTSPAAKLHIDVVAEDNQPAFKITKVSDGGENAMEVYHGTSSSTRGIADFTNSNGSVMYLRGDGNVGIGTTAAGSILEIQGNGGNNTQLRLASGSSSAYWDIGRNYNSGHFEITEDSGDTYFLIDKDNGNVGIGSAAPSQKLSIKFADTDTSFSSGAGGAWGSEGILIENTSSNTGTMAMIQLRNGDADIHIAGIRQAGADSDLGFFFEGVEKMRLDSSGKLGIGTTAPASKLHVTGTVQVGVDGTGHDVFFYGDTAGKYLKWDQSEDTLFFPDNTYITFGGGSDATIGVSSDNLVITNTTADKDIIFQADNGSGGGNVTEYFRLDGSYGGAGYPTTIFPNDSSLRFGNSGELQIIRTGGHSYIQNNTSGNLHIRNASANEDLVFEADNGAGSGNVATYFWLDGGEATHSGSATTALYTIFPDKSRIALGTGKDLMIFHDGSNSYIQDGGDGDLIVNASTFRLRAANNASTMITGFEGAAVSLYHNNSVRLETTAGGVKISGGVEHNVTGISNVNYTVLATDYIVHYATLTGSGKTVTLNSDQCTEGRVLIIKDGAGTAGQGYSITIGTEGSETIDGADTKVISSNYGSVTLYADHLGANWFTI